MVDAQQDVIAFLRRPSSYDGGAAPVATIETHASIVFLAGERAYKLKRAVKYPYLDFSTAARRRAACEAELALNSRTAPQLYLAVEPVSRLPDGTIGWGGLGGNGVALDWVVVMRRFDQQQLLDNVARAGRLSVPLMQALAAHIAQFHAHAEIRPDQGGAAAMGEVALANIECLRDCRSAGFAIAQIDAVNDRLGDELLRLAPLLDQRRAQGKVRRVHGDLHLRNICLLDGRPVLFDGIEFSEALASIDVLYDLAFLLMDLDYRGYRDLANLTLNRYLDLAAEDDGLAAMPFFLSVRAMIRAQVTATMAEHDWGSGDRAPAFAEARRYLDEARIVLRPAPARLIAIGGLSGSGKSTLATGLAAELGLRPGARVLRSDVLRKCRAGVEPETPLPPGAYTAEATALVYGDMCARAATALRAGYCVVIDAVALAEEERRSFAAVAAAVQVPFSGLWLAAPAATMMARIEGRRADASDASREVLARQLEWDTGMLDWTVIDAGGGPDATLAAARRALRLG